MVKAGGPTHQAAFGEVVSLLFALPVNDIVTRRKEFESVSVTHGLTFFQVS